MDKQKESELKIRLERRLYQGQRELTPGEWGFLKDEELLNTYEHDPLETEAENFDELERGARKKLEIFRKYFGSTSTSHVEKTSCDDSLEESQGGLPEISEGLNKNRAYYRAAALWEYDQRHNDPDTLDLDSAPFSPVTHAASFITGGRDGATPHWTVLIQAQAWVPAEEVAALFRAVQQYLCEGRVRQVGARKSKVVSFIWEMERIIGSRPPWPDYSWPELARRWKARYPKEEPFNPDTFAKSFYEGEAAMLPRYRLSEEELRSLTENGANKAAFDRWAERVRESL